MFQRLHKQFGTAGLVLSIVALVFALAGGAYAANHAATASKAKAGKPGPRGKTGKTGPAGPAGPAGATGPAGPAGANGKDGALGIAGKDGTNGVDGKSVEAVSASITECPEGGTEFKVGGVTKGKACNGEAGEEGEPWTPNNTLPTGATETGAWATRPAEGEEALIPISFNIQLSAELDNEHVLTPASAEFASKCTGTVETPKAAGGYLCVYTGFVSEVTVGNVYKTYGLNQIGAGRTGAALFVTGTGAPALANGTWAVTAE